MPGTTGISPLPDTGRLSYNGVQFSALYRSKVSGKVVLDAASRATRYFERTLEVDGQVTLEAGQQNTDQTWLFIRQRLTQPGATLSYFGQGYGSLNVGGPYPLKDVAWGPIPEILDFQTLGQMRSSNISWKCVTRTVDIPGGPKAGNGSPGPVVQFNYESALSYDEEYYATVTLKGTLEIPLTRGPQNSRAVTQTVDDFRQAFLNIGFDLTKYRVTRRTFTMSRDKRTYEWEYQITEHAPAGIPFANSGARGTMSIRNLKQGGKTGLLATPLWVCSMKCTYALRSDFPRRLAFMAFCALLWHRMWSSLNGEFPDVKGANNKQQVALRNATRNAFQNAVGKIAPVPLANLPPGAAGALQFYQQLAANQKQVYTAVAQAIILNPAALGDPLSGLLTTAARLVDFTADEGLYDDSKTVTFGAAWAFTCTFETLMAGSGIWQYAPDTGGFAWATSVGDIVGWRGPLAARIDPTVEVIVDMGGGGPLTGLPIKAE